MKGFANLDTGHVTGVGMDLSGIPTSAPIVSPPNWTVKGGFLQGQGHKGPGVKARCDRGTRRWLSRLQKADVDARTEAVVDAMADDDTIDEILEMLDVAPQCSSSLLHAPTVSA